MPDFGAKMHQIRVPRTPPGELTARPRSHIDEFKGLLKGERERGVERGGKGAANLLRSSFYRAMHFSAKRGIAIACRLSVRPSVCLSVCLVCNVGEL